MKLFNYIDLCFEKFGIKRVFGVPGSLIMPIWQNITNADIMLCSHEQEASYVATGYSKMSGEPVAVITTGGPGVTNCISGIAAANLDSVPLIYISGRTPETKKGYGLRQEEGPEDRNYDSVEIMNSMTKKSVIIQEKSTIIEDVWNVFCLAVTKRMGSVHMSIPVDIQETELDDFKIHTFINRCVPDNCTCEDFSAFDDIIKCQDKAIIVMGWGCWQAKCVELVYNLANKISAPVLVTAKAYGCIKDSNKYIGKLGYGINDFLIEFIDEFKAEKLLCFGTSFSKKDFSKEIRSRFKDENIYIFSNSVNDSRKHNVYANWCEISDLTSFLTYYYANCTENQNKSGEIIDFYKNKQIEFYTKFIKEEDLMAKALVSLAQNLTYDMTITADAGNNLLNCATLITPRYLGNLILDDGIRAMGSGVCQTAGMALANPKRKYISVVGDGGMLMNGNILYLIAKYKLQILVLVVNNESLGRVRMGQLNTNKYIQSDLGSVDFAVYARAFGIESYEVEKLNDYNEIVLNYIENPRPLVIQLNTSINEIPIMLKSKGVWN